MITPEKHPHLYSALDLENATPQQIQLFTKSLLQRKKHKKIDLLGTEYVILGRKVMLNHLNLDKAEIIAKERFLKYGAGISNTLILGAAAYFASLSLHEADLNSEWKDAFTAFQRATKKVITLIDTTIEDEQSASWHIAHDIMPQVVQAIFESEEKRNKIMEVIGL